MNRKIDYSRISTDNKYEMEFMISYSNCLNIKVEYKKQLPEVVKFLEDIVVSYENVIIEYLDMVNNGSEFNINIFKDVYEWLYEFCSIKCNVNTSKLEWNKKLYKYVDKEYSEEMLKVSESIVKRSGAYKLYDKNKNVVYVGKSTQGLGSRLLSTVYENDRYKTVRYFSYTLIENRSDTSIYEIYYISKLKPLLNIESNHIEDTTLILPELEFTELKPIFPNDFLK